MLYKDWDDTPSQVVSQELSTSKTTKEAKAEPGKARVSEKFTTSKKTDEKELSITSQEQTGQLYRCRLHHVIFIFTRRVEIRQSYDLLRNIGLRVL